MAGRSIFTHYRSALNQSTTALGDLLPSRRCLETYQPKVESVACYTYQAGDGLFFAQVVPRGSSGCVGRGWWPLRSREDLDAGPHKGHPATRGHTTATVAPDGATLHDRGRRGPLDHGVPLPRARVVGTGRPPTARDQRGSRPSAAVWSLAARLLVHVHRVCVPSCPTRRSGGRCPPTRPPPLPPRAGG